MFKHGKVNASIHINLTHKELGLSYKEGEPIPVTIGDNLQPGEQYDELLVIRKVVEIWNDLCAVAHFVDQKPTPITVYILPDFWQFAVYLGLCTLLKRNPTLIVVNGESRHNMDFVIGGVDSYTK